MSDDEGPSDQFYVLFRVYKGVLMKMWRFLNGFASLHAVCFEFSSATVGRNSVWTEFDWPDRG